MEKFNLMGHSVIVDVVKTRELYESLPLVSDKEHCGCDDCSYYTEAIVRTSPATKQFFHQSELIREKRVKFGKLLSSTMVLAYTL